ncbi:hypothetical protein [Emticicia sp. 17c]|uniref:hypothetical protein n=1 Tax=Emticicia sp. 17c TaxID=3127704 RepID=UPI00301CA3A6
MQKIIHSLIIVFFTSVVSFAKEIQPLVLPSGEIIKPRHDGKHYFITNHFVIAQPTQTEIETAIADAQSQGRIITMTSSGLDIPQALQEVSSLPVTFRNRIDGWNYDITVFAITFTPEGSKLKIGCKFTLPNGINLYFGANDIAASGKNGFVGELPILTSMLTDTKASEIDDADNLLAGETNFFEFSVPNFNDKLSMGLDKETKLYFECGTFKKFTISGFVKSYDFVEREATDGTALTDGKPLMLFFGKKDIYDWQDIYIEAQVSRAFHDTRISDLGFHFASGNKAIIDFSKNQNPNSLPSCVNTDDWQGIYFPAFQVRLPKFFKLRSGVNLPMRAGKNLFIDKSGLVGNMTAEKVYDLPEGYTDDINNFDMSLDLITATFLCNQMPQVTMLGRIQLGKCGGKKTAKLLYYNFLYDKVRNTYSFLIKDSETGIYTTNKITLSSGSSITFGISGESLVLNTKLSKTPQISTTAYNKAVCSNNSTTLSISNCETGMFKWNTAKGDANISPLSITPNITANQETIVYQANCFDEYCINESSNAISLTVYNGLPSLTLTSNKGVTSAICSYETAKLEVGGDCPGILQWITPENTTFQDDDNRTKTVFYPQLSNLTTQQYKVACNLNGCMSTNNPEINIQIKKAIDKPLLTTNQTDNKVCTGQSIEISGNCSNSTDIFSWTEGVANTGPNTFTLTTDIAKPQNKEYFYKAKCINDGCEAENEIKVNEYAIKQPNIFVARNPIEIGGTTEIIAFGCERDTYIWSNGKIGVWDGQNGSIMRENIYENKTYSVRCVVNGCSSSATTPITVYVESCESIYPKPSVYYVSNNNPIAGEEVEIGVKGCPNNKFEWDNGAGVVWTGVEDMYTTKFYPTADTEYKVRCVRDAGCASGWVTAVSIKVKNCKDSYTKPSIYYVSNNSPIAGEEVEIGVKGCPNNKFEWDNGAGVVWTGVEDMYTTKFYPTADTEYKVRCVRDAGCASGWVTAVSIKVKNCEDSYTKPSIYYVSNNSPIAGEEVEVGVRGCPNNKFEWDNGAGVVWTGVEDMYTTKFYPTADTEYKVRCVRDVGCASGWVTLSVRIKSMTVTPCTNPTATPNISSNKTNLSSDTDSVILTATGCNGTVNWNNNSNGGQISVSTPGKYSAKCNINGCISNNSNEIVIIKEGCIIPAAPLISAEKIILKENESTKVTATGCTGSISWSNGSKGYQIVVSNRGKYTATCNVNGCTSEVSNEIEIKSENCITPFAPSITITKSVIIVGEKVVVNGVCVNGTLEWKSPSNFTGGEVKPISNTTYEAVCTTSTGCSSDKASGTITVNITGTPVRYNPPLITVSSDLITKGQTVKVTATCETGSRVSWIAPSGFNGGDHKPDASIVYKVKCEKNYPFSDNILEDSDESSKQVIVVCPTIIPPVISTNKTEITDDEKATITAVGCNGGAIQWRNASNGNQITVGAGSYSALCVIDGCYSKESNVITIKIGCKKPNAPVISATKLVTYNDEKAIITASNCTGTTVWSDKNSGNKIEVNSGTYFAICEANGCKSDFSNEITVTNKKYFSYTVSVKIKKIGFHADYEETITFYSKEALRGGINFYDDIDCTSFQRFFKWWADWLYNDYGTFVYGGVTYAINVKTGYITTNTPR